MAEYKRESHRDTRKSHRVLFMAECTRENLTEILENLTGYRVLSTEYCSWLSTRENLTEILENLTGYCSWLSTRENLTEILENLTGYRVLSTGYYKRVSHRVLFMAEYKRESHRVPSTEY